MEKMCTNISNYNYMYEYLSNTSNYPGSYTKWQNTIWVLISLNVFILCIILIIIMIRIRIDTYMYVLVLF